MKKLLLLLTVIVSQTLLAQTGEMIFFPLIGNPNFAAAYMVRAKNPSKKVLLIFHDYWGLNDSIKLEAEKFAAEMPDVTVYVLDFYDGNIATDTVNANKFLSNLTKERGMQIINGIIGYAGNEKHFATLGFGIPGFYWSQQSAVRLGRSAKACVMYYDFPESKTPIKYYVAPESKRKILKRYHCKTMGISKNPEYRDAHTIILKFLKANLK